MTRKPLGDSIFEMIRHHYMLCAIIGFSIYVLFVRRRTPRNNVSRRVPSAPVSAAPILPSRDSIVTSLRQQKFVGSKVCITWDALESRTMTDDSSLNIIERLVRSSDLFILCKVLDGNQQKRILDTLRPLASVGLNRKNVLFCSSHKGYEAFTRQIMPSLLVTHDPSQATFLARVLPFIILVRENRNVDFPNVQCIDSVDALFPSPNAVSR